MRLARWIVIACLAACNGTSKTAPAAGSAAGSAMTDRAERDANAAYEAKQWDRCGELYAQIGGKDAEYNAACCFALAGKTEPAFAALERSIGAGLRSVDHVKQDADLTSLHADPRWARAIATIEANVAAWEKTLKEPALRREILALVAEDQAARNAWIAAGVETEHPELAKRVAEIDAKSTARMKEIVATHGWPGTSLVGADGANGAWLLVQHADRDRAFQRQCLPLLEAAMKAGEVRPQDYAYLYDRVAVADDKPQRYGTQFRDGEPFPIEDEAHVDERRKAVGLGTLAEYREQIRQMYGR